jgi:hypothetical protein
VAIGGSELREVTGNQSVSVGGNVQQIVDGNVFALYGALSASVTGATAVQGSGEIKVESATAQKIGAPMIYVSAGSQLFLRALDCITLQVGDAKITIEDGHVFVTCGSSQKTLAGDTLKLNC